ncbi:MAG: tetratricopeptide repeat protein [Acidobacteria bacterium]|nr:tetratricopeptide repeat protein [Acidobacteriota bacterium]NIM62949.1 tetratricopeptide repeat protein [Acidobacteriota bacterium]NIO60631.1 tetratricopeptide repeat protein [Acidobacteriota bacterium]NIQ31722.1 tetratricopeptide repeat protein [Acidobacteriota bacterium]NIQ86992.1 tetratricopeptide repeat protein [Acidobacteriota bacterium]
MFLLGGFAFGVLVGFGLFRVYQDRPQFGEAAVAQELSAPAGPRAPAQGAVPQGGGAAPMVGELNELKRRLEANPQDIEAAIKLGGMYYQVGMWDQAGQFYEIALGIRPDDPDLLIDAGNVHRELGRHTQALDNFRRAYEIDPDHWQALFNTVVVAAFDLQQMDLADAAMAKLEEVDPPPQDLPALKQALAELRTSISTSGSSQ